MFLDSMKLIFKEGENDEKEEIVERRTMNFFTEESRLWILDGNKSFSLD